MRNLFAFLLLATSGLLHAQKPPIKFGDIPIEDMKMTVFPKDSSAEAVVLADYGESTIAYQQNQGFKLSFERLRRIKILTKDGLRWGDFSISLYHDSDQEEKVTSLKVVTYNLENGKIVETKAKNDSYLKEKYDANFNVTKITWPNVKVGSILEISYKVSSDFLFNFQDWEFQESIPTRWSEYRARIPEYFNYEKYMQGYVVLSVNETDSQQNSISVTYTTRSGGTGFTPVSSTINNENISYRENRFRWAASDVPAFKKEPFITTPKDYISKMNFELSYTNFSQEFANPGIKQYMGSWEDINTAYWKSVGDEIMGNNSLKNQIETITTGLTTPDQKVNAIFNYVRQNVLWDGSYRKYPENSAKKTLEAKKGSSAEVNFLLACLLEKAEFNVSPVLLSTRDHGFVRETTPISSQFNDVVCLARVGDKSVLLDATDKFLPLGMIPEECLNGRGFVVSNEGFKWISLQPTTKTRTIFSTDLTLAESGELKGSLKIDKSGYSSVKARKSYVTKGEKDYLSSLSEGRSWIVSKSEFKDANEPQQPFKEAHEIIISEHITEAGNMIYLSPFILAKAEENPFKQETRNYPVDFGHSFDQMYLAKITIPDGYVIDELPKAKLFALPENAAKYSYNVSQTGNTLNITSSLNINKSLFTQLEYPNLREFYNLMVAKQAEQIVLKKK
jgi:hypothetical protein